MASDVVFLISEVNLKMKIEDWFFFFLGGDLASEI